MNFQSQQTGYIDASTISAPPEKTCSRALSGIPTMIDFVEGLTVASINASEGFIEFMADSGSAIDSILA